MFYNIKKSFFFSEKSFNFALAKLKNFINHFKLFHYGKCYFKRNF